MVHLNNPLDDDERRKGVIKMLRKMRDELKRKGMPFFKIIRKPYYKTTPKAEPAELVSAVISKQGTNPPKGAVWNKVPDSISC